MTTLSHPPTPVAPAPSAVKTEQRIVIPCVSWDEYVKIGELFVDRPALRITYDRGLLEFMTTSPRHGRYMHWLGRFLETIAEELRKSIVPGGSMTFQREDLDRGFEPDNCYWIDQEQAVRDKLTWDPTIDPPPDVMIEIEVSRSALNRMGIYAAFRIPEIWCYDGDEVRIYVLQPDGKYLPDQKSLAFPTIPVKDLARFFPPAGSSDYLTSVASVRAWVRSFIDKPS